MRKTALGLAALTAVSASTLATAPAAHAASPSNFARYCGSGYTLVLQAREKDVTTMLFRKGSLFCGLAQNMTGRRAPSQAYLMTDAGGTWHRVGRRDSGNFLIYAGPVYASVATGNWIEVVGVVNKSSMTVGWQA